MDVDKINNLLEMLSSNSEEDYQLGISILENQTDLFDKEDLVKISDEIFWKVTFIKNKASRRLEINTIVWNKLKQL